MLRAVARLRIGGDLWTSETRDNASDKRPALNKRTKCLCRICFSAVTCLSSTNSFAAGIFQAYEIVVTTDMFLVEHCGTLVALWRALTLKVTHFAHRVTLFVTSAHLEQVAIDCICNDLKELIELLARRRVFSVTCDHTASNVCCFKAHLPESQRFGRFLVANRAESFRIIDLRPWPFFIRFLAHALPPT